ncbi:MAG: hypothetical protein U1F43_09690 [Myxococcota bacterium]
MHQFELRSPTPSGTQPAPSLATVFAGFLDRMLASCTGVEQSPKNRARVEGLHAAEYRAEPLCAANSTAAIDLVCAQFASEPLTLVVGFSSEVLRATIEAIVADCIALDAAPSVVITSRGEAVAVGITVPFEEVLTIAPGMPPEVARLFAAMNQVNAHVTSVRQRLGDPLRGMFEWLLAAVAPEHRRRLPVAESCRPASMFQTMVLTVFQVARQRGYRTVMAHTNEQSARPLFDLGLVTEMALPYSELVEKVRTDIPGNLNFTTGDLHRILAPFDHPDVRR